MTSFTRNLILSMFAGAAIASTSASAATFRGVSDDYGQVVTTSAVDKVVKVDASTRWFNVTDGQTVRFDVDGKSFTFNFATWPGDQQVDLSTIAPKDMVVPNVRVYIAPNPLYFG